MTDLEVRTEDGVLWLTFNRPEVLNAVDGPMMVALATSLEEARARDDVRVVVITGTGAGFSAGADMASLRLAPEHPVETMDGANRVIRAVVGLDKPVLAAVNGVAAGVACSAALASDIIVAAESAAFLLPFSRIGLMTDGGSSATVAASIGRARAMRMALLAEPLSAADALACGLITHVAPDREFPAVVARLAGRLASGPALALAGMKKAINAATLPHLEAALDREHSGQRALFTTRDFTEGLDAFASGRKPDFHGD
ncbi:MULTISPECIES: enoyl-CoA hydratase [unclassified Nocardioides]|uniref:enoyl-CoA hydratase n=1 Tax=unclassified Nocardioides TaxID=2615069 RepID=UPI0009F16052|nr:MULTISPECIES: enoyl-CoA hydratase [unclassified Nocardioides]GAW50063.1 Enoyl-CoA hydratase [Nocardioides sp. PD653-B2]GAW57382.1 Enoyl-CoA hydratase [Nocardioides sp. PD653]